MGRPSKRRRLHYHEERLDNVHESNYSDGKVGEGLRTGAQEGSSDRPKGKEIRDLGSARAVEMSGSGFRLGDVEHGAAWNEDEGDGEIEDQDDEDEDGEKEDDEDDDDEDEDGEDEDDEEEDLIPIPISVTQPVLQMKMQYIAAIFIEKKIDI